mgnify:CR=1 FL=1
MEKTPLIILDTSVMIKWFTNEENSNKAIEYRDKHIDREIEIIEPDLLLYEISNALRYNPNFEEIDVMNALESIFDLGIEIITPTKKLLYDTIEISYKYDITGYDATYIALSNELSGKFINSNKKLYEKTKNLLPIEIL